MSDRRYLLFGPTAIQGYALVRRGDDRIHPLVTSARASGVARTWDRILVEDEEALHGVEFEAFDGIIYAHAVCDVPNAEESPEWATEKNVTNLRRILDRVLSGTRFVYVSSDHVFGHDGRYDESCPPCPISHYGRTRIAAEALVAERENTLIVRAPLAIGPSVDGRTGHSDWLRYRIGRGFPVTIISDEARSAVLADDLADRLIALADSDRTGLRHVAAPVVDRPTLAAALCDHLDVDRAYDFAARSDQQAPHLGRIELATQYADPLAAPLPSVLDRLSELPPVTAA